MGVYFGGSMASAITNNMLNTLRFSIKATEATFAFLVLLF
jgi:hypothetical protein